MRAVQFLTVAVLLGAWPPASRAAEAGYEVVVEAAREPPVAITAARAEPATPRAEVMLRNTSRKPVTRIALRWHTLGMQYRTGEGRPQDDVLAYAWLHLSALTGNGASIEARDALEARMAAEDIEEAVRLSRTWAVDQLAP